MVWMLKRKMFVPILLSGILLLSACSDSDNASGNSDSKSGKTEIKITWRGLGEQDNIKRYLEGFEADFESENEDIDIVLSPITASEGDYFSKVALTMQSAETAPDIVSEDTFMLSADANAGYLKPLDEYVESWDEWDNFIENIKSGTTGDDGTVYGIPTTTDSRGIWFNKEVFEAAGLPSDWEPKSWEDVYAAAETIKEENADVVPFAMNVAKANGEAVSMQTFEMLLYGTGETLYDGENGKWNVNGQGITDSLVFVDEIMNKRDLGPSLSIALNANYSSVMTQDLLPTGGVGMVLDGNWNIAHYTEGGAHPLEDIEATLGFVPFPTKDGQSPGFITMSGGWGWSIPEKSKNHDVAWKVIQAMSTEDLQTKRALTGGTLAVRNDSAESSDYLERPLIEQATKALENANFRPKNDLYPNVSIEIQNAVEAVASGTMSPEEAAANYKSKVTDIVGEENVY
ncbi:ABC transporter substrate-binding protein [Oceanobacillus zhaokaii]|uniref:ABC transporter substrate-binding protein n=2 Tax=Oceanobacillus zhaokaii TaxID=2052660 RepID=A0A345PJY0_9BACI|nr:ABC transporter substrate-binding protein [Oceanobacillus zhaokaii]